MYQNKILKEVREKELEIEDFIPFSNEWKIRIIKNKAKECNKSKLKVMKRSNTREFHTK